MPGGVFQPYSGVSTAILIFTKTGHGGTDKVWFYNMEADGFSLDAKRTEVEENDIPDIIERWNNLDVETSRTKHDKSFFVQVEEIREKKYDLSINRYREVAYVVKEYPPAKEIIAKIEQIQHDLSNELINLKRML